MKKIIVRRALYKKMFIFAMYLTDYKYVKNIISYIQNDILFRRKHGKKCHFISEKVSEGKTHQNQNMMKKLFITPQKDTVTICLPSEWVGKPLVCVLRHPDEKNDYPEESEFVSYVREDNIGYNADLFKQKRRPRKKRLRRIRGGKNKLL